VREQTLLCAACRQRTSALVEPRQCLLRLELIGNEREGAVAGTGKTRPSDVR